MESSLDLIIGADIGKRDLVGSVYNAEQKQHHERGIGERGYKSPSTANSRITERKTMCGYRRPTSTIENAPRRRGVVIVMSTAVGNGISIRTWGQLFRRSRIRLK